MAESSPTIRHRLEAFGAALIYTFFLLLPVDAASRLGGWLGRTIGPRLGISRRARHNLSRAFSELDPAAVEQIVAEMWDNLGRVLGEFPHLAGIAADTARIEIVGREHLEPFRADGIPCILISGHLANWELFAMARRRVHMDFVQVYRAPNNPFIDAMLRRVRRLEKTDIAPKGPQGARSAVIALRAGRRLGILVDQKMNDGIAVPFFGRDAMTATAPAQLALRYRCPIIPARLERLNGCRFRLTFLAPLVIADTGDRRRDVAATMTAINKLLESWIRDRPGQWLWLHRRWPES